VTAPFVSQLRARPGIVRIGADDQPRISLRVQVPEVWDVVVIEAPATEPVATIKAKALAVLYPEAESTDAFVLKLNGYEVLDESVTVADSGAMSGSTFLLTHRRRRPVR
jgi:hypothetical protein